MCARENHRRRNDKESGENHRDYLYHIQSPGLGDGSSEGQGPAKRRARQHSFQNAAEEELFSHLRKFAVFAGIMVLLLAAAVYIAQVTWKMKQKAGRGRGATETGSLAATPSRADRSATRTSDTAPVQPEENSEVAARLTAERGRVLAGTDEYGAAIEKYHEALQLDPTLQEVWADLGRAYLHDRRVSAATEALEKAVEAMPENAAIWNDLGISYLYQQKFRKAENAFRQAIQYSPAMAESYLNLARAQTAQADTEGARATLDESMGFVTNDARILKETAYLDAVAGRYDTALERLDEALALRPEWAALYFDAASLHALKGAHEESIAHLLEAEEYTSPGKVYRIYLQPAFRNLRLTDEGKAFERALAGRAREMLNGESRQRGRRMYKGEPIGSVFYSPEE